MRALIVLGAIGLGSAAGIRLVTRVLRPDAEVPVRPCQACGRVTSARDAHTHHHADSCDTAACACDPWLCKACCPCSLEALLEVAR